MPVTGSDNGEIYLERLNPDKIGEYYAAWMRDPEVVKYLESRWTTHTPDSIRDYVRQMNESRRDFLFGIFLSETGQHIGNIKIGQIHPVHRYADVGLLIGERACRGRGYGTQAIVLATSYAFSELHLNSLTAGIYAPNLASYRAFIKAGWEDAGRYRRHRFFEGSFIDQINVQKCNEI